MTPDHPNGAWTAGQIKELLKSIIDERDKLYTERAETHRREVSAALVAADRRFGELYALKGEVAQLQQDIALTTAELAHLAGERAGIKASWVFFLAAVGLIGTLLGMAWGFIK